MRRNAPCRRQVQHRLTGGAAFTGRLRKHGDRSYDSPLYLRLHCPTAPATDGPSRTRTHPFACRRSTGARAALAPPALGRRAAGAAARGRAGWPSWWLIKRPPAERRAAAAARGHGRARGGAAGRHAGDDRGAGHRDAAATVRRPQVAGVLSRCCSRKARWCARASCWRVIDPRQFEMALMQAGPAPARRGAAGERARHAGALSHAAAAGLDRAPGSRHPGRAGQAARRHGHDRPRHRRHGPAEPRLHAHRRAGRRAASACARSTSATWSAPATPTASP